MRIRSRAGRRPEEAAEWTTVNAMMLSPGVDLVSSKAILPHTLLTLG